MSQQLLHEVADLRRLLLQDIFVGQSNTKTVEDMWARFCEARHSGMESLLKCQQQDAEMTRLRSAIASCRAALQNAALTQSSLERRVTEREGEIATLKHRLQACEDANRDLLVCTARLSESIFDLAGAADVDAEADRVRVRYDQMETRNAHLQRLMAWMSEEKSALERQVYQWAESHQQLRAQSETVIAGKDRTIEMLQAVVAKTE